MELYFREIKLLKIIVTKLQINNKNQILSEKGSVVCGLKKQRTKLEVKEIYLNSDSDLQSVMGKSLGGPLTGFFTFREMSPLYL